MPIFMIFNFTYSYTYSKQEASYFSTQFPLHPLHSSICIARGHHVLTLVFFQTGFIAWKLEMIERSTFTSPCMDGLEAEDFSCPVGLSALQQLPFPAMFLDKGESLSPLSISSNWAESCWKADVSTGESFVPCTLLLAYNTMRQHDSHGLG